MTLDTHRRRMIFLSCLAAVYFIIFFFLCSTTLYDTGGHNDRLFSADDQYYVTEFFSKDMDDSLRIIKHPLLIVFGCLFTKIEYFFLGAIRLRHHYECIVLMQIAASVISIAYLDRILEEHYHIKPLYAELVCLVYAFAFSTVFFTFVAESYILSSLVLMMSYWYAREQRTLPTIVLGVLAAGITITNAVLWAIIVFFSGGSLRRRIAEFFAAGTIFCLLVAILPIRTVFYSSIFTGAMNSARNYSSHLPVSEAVIWMFSMLICTPFFSIDMVNASPFGDFSGDALSFVPVSNAVTICFGVMWMIVLLYAIIKCRRSPLILSPLAVLAANFILHGIIQYGLKEGFLYCLHHLSAQLLIGALLLCPEAGKRSNRLAVAAFSSFFAAEFLVNAPGYLRILGFLQG